MSVRVPKTISVFEDRTVQPDVPHDAAGDMALSLETSALAWRGSANTRHFIFPDADEAPRADITAVATNTNFNIGDSSSTYDYYVYSVPWRMTEGFDRIGCVMVVATYDSHALVGKLWSKTLVDSVVSVEGDARNLRAWNLTGTTDWRAQEYSWRTMMASPSARGGMAYLYTICYVTPTLPATRVVKVLPQVQLSYGNELIDLGGTIEVYLKQLTLFDMPDSEVPI